MRDAVNINRQDISRVYMSAEAYETTLGLRVDLLSALAYCTPIMGVIMLILETKNDYVRVHAYQSILVAFPLVVLHFLLLSSHFLQLVLFIIDLAIYAWLGYQSYFDAEVLDRRLLPIVGSLAEQWTSEE